MLMFLLVKFEEWNLLLKFAFLHYSFLGGGGNWEPVMNTHILSILCTSFFFIIASWTWWSILLGTHIYFIFLVFPFCLLFQFMTYSFLDASPITNCMFRHENAEQLVFLLYLYFHFVKIGQFTVRFASQNFPSSIINRSMTEIREHVKWFLLSINTFKLFIGLFFENI